MIDYKKIFENPEAYQDQFEGYCISCEGDALILSTDTDDITISNEVEKEVVLYILIAYAMNFANAIEAALIFKDLFSKAKIEFIAYAAEKNRFDYKEGCIGLDSLDRFYRKFIK